MYGGPKSQDTELPRQKSVHHHIWGTDELMQKLYLVTLLQMSFQIE
jgi:hypothetical protein